MEIKELKERVAIEKKKVEASQKKRDAIVILSFVGVYFLLLYFFGEKPVARRAKLCYNGRKM